MQHPHDIMTFDLNINLKEFEVKAGLIDIKAFLNLNNHIAYSIKDICKFSHYVNFAETIVNGFQIFGETKRIFNHKRFTSSLEYFQEKHQTTWVGHFTYKDKVDSFIFYAPKFQIQRFDQ